MAKFSSLNWWTLVILFIQPIAAVYCGANSTCPEETPCCSQYGECGVGSYCLGACDPRYSFNLSACMPLPACKNTHTKFTSTDQFLSTSKYLGNASEADWIYDGHILEYEDSIIMAMPKSSGGAVVSSTRYLWYGHVDMTMKTSRGQGVITAFILFLNVQDEIDYENVGSELEVMQTNYYYQGILSYNHSTNVTTSNTFDNYHVLGVDWTEDRIEWLVDGKVSRTLTKESTWNATTRQYAYPQTPSRVQISLWPGGAVGAAPGTIAWAGGLVDWDSEDMKNPGYYYAFISEANITCYDPPVGVVKSGTSAYVYTNKEGNSSDIKITDDKTYLGSFDNTGFNPGNDKNTSNANSTESDPSVANLGVGNHPGGSGSNGVTTSSNTYTYSGFMQFAASSSIHTASTGIANAIGNTKKLLATLSIAIAGVISLAML